MTERATFVLDQADVAGLREAVSSLGRIGYSEDGVRDRLNLADMADLQWRRVPVYRSESLASRDPLALAIELFLLQGTIPADELNRLFARPECDLLFSERPCLVGLAAGRAEYASVCESRRGRQIITTSEGRVIAGIRFASSSRPAWEELPVRAWRTGARDCLDPS